MSERPETQRSRLQESRREAEARLEEVRAALRTELGHTPKKRGLWLAIVAGAVGLALGVRRTAKKRRRAARPA
jgi:hypothetical protein